MTTSLIALDLDGTILDYSPAGSVTQINAAVLDALTARGVRQVTIVTNQGGLPFGVLGARRKTGEAYPTPAQFLARLAAAIDALRARDIAVVATAVCVFHPGAETSAIKSAADIVHNGLRTIERGRWQVFTTAAARKPRPLMLLEIGADEYWGDSDEDEGAARAAGVPFVHVDRFFGEVEP